MEQPIKEKNLLEKVARKNTASRKEVESNIMGVCENMIAFLICPIDKSPLSAYTRYIKTF